MATVYAFMNSKGGVGKTTLAANIGNEIAEIAKTDVLLVDTDPQCNLTQIFYAPSALGSSARCHVTVQRLTGLKS